MVALQRHILVTSDFRLLVTEQQLLDACRILDGASAAISACGGSNPSSSNARSSSSTASLGVIQHMVACQVQHYQAWYDSEAARLQQAAHEQLQQVEEEQEDDSSSSDEEDQEAEEVAQTAAMQLFPQEITGTLLAEPSAAAAAAAVGSLDACERQQQRLQDQQLRQALYDISNTSALQLPGAAKPLLSAGHRTSAGQAPTQQPQQQSLLPGRPCNTRQQDKQHPPNAGPVQAPQARAASSKQVLLQLASREQAVGSKRRRDACDAAAAAAEPLSGTGAAAGTQVQSMRAQQGSSVASGFGAGGKRMLLKVMRTAQSAAAQYFGCRQ